MSARFVYGFVVVYIWVNSDTRGQLEWTHLVVSLKFHVWDRVLCRLTGNESPSTDRKFQRFQSRWPDWYGDWLFLQIRVRKDSVQINHSASKFYSHTQGVTDYNAHRSVRGLGGQGKRHTYMYQNNGSLRVYFRRLDSALHWEWDTMEFANRSSVEWRGSHQWAVTCWIGVQSFCVRWRRDEWISEWKLIYI